MNKCDAVIWLGREHYDDLNPRRVRDTSKSA